MESLQEYARGITGGLLFSFPLLYTMEVWWAGFIAPPYAILILVLTTFTALLAYNRYSGMHPDATWTQVALDSIEEMGIGLIISFGVLHMLNRIQFGQMAIDEIMGKIVIESMAVSIGVSIGTAQLGAEDQKNGGELEKNGNRSSKPAIVALGFCGAIVVGGNVAPTEEIIMLAMESDPIHIMMMAVISLLISVVAVYFSNLRGSNPDRPDNFWYELTFDTCLCYLIALTASAFLLWFFGRLDGISFWIGFSQCIVLGVLASLGSSAGRLLIK